MLIQELYGHYGSWAETMLSLEMGSTSYQAWLRRGSIPYRTQQIIESHTRGLFKAEKSHDNKVDGRKKSRWVNKYISSDLPLDM